MKKYVEFIAKTRRLLLILLVLLNVFAIIGIFKINISTDFDIFVPTESNHKDNLDFMNELFESSDSLTVIIEKKGSDISSDILADFEDIQHYLLETNGINEVRGPADSPLDTYKKMGKLSPVTVEDNKVYGIFECFATDEFSGKEIKIIEDYFNQHNYTFYLSGDIYMQQKIFNYLLLILCIIPPTALVLVLLIFRTQIGSIKSTIFSVLPAGIGALWTMGVIGWSGVEVSIITILAPIFTVVIGSADGLHFISHVQESRKEGKGRLESIEETLKMVGIPMIITTITSVAGFISLLVMKTDAIKDLALFASLGITFAGIATWYVLPVVLSGKTKLKIKENKNLKNKFNIQKLWGIPSVAIVLVLLIVAGIGIFHIRTEFNQLMIYHQRTDVYKNFTKIMNVNDGSVPVFLLATTESNPLLPENAMDIIALQEKIEASEHVKKIISVYDMYAFVNSTMQGENAYPDNPMLIEKIEQYLGDTTVNLVNKESNTIRMLIFPSGFENTKLDSISAIVNDFEQNNKSIKFRLTGTGYLMRDLNNSMIKNQSNSLIMAFALIFILLLISIRKIIPTIKTTIPIAITVVVLYGFLGLSGISLNIITATIFSITIGVGIDYAVHYSSVFMAFKKQGFSSDESVNKAYQYTSKPIMANAFGIAVGFSALLLSPLQIHAYVSTLMWVSMICGVFLSLSFLPTLLKWGE